MFCGFAYLTNKRNQCFTVVLWLWKLMAIHITIDITIQTIDIAGYDFDAETAPGTLGRQWWGLEEGRNGGRGSLGG